MIGMAQYSQNFTDGKGKGSHEGKGKGSHRGPVSRGSSFGSRFGGGPKGLGKVSRGKGGPRGRGRGSGPTDRIKLGDPRSLDDVIRKVKKGFRKKPFVYRRDRKKEEQVRGPEATERRKRKNEITGEVKKDYRYSR